MDLPRVAGDFIDDESLVLYTATLSNNAWTHGGRRYEVNSFHLSAEDGDFWCYELYEVDPGNDDNIYLEVRIPDFDPAGGPFTPGPADQVMVIAHGDWTVPWPVFASFVHAIRSSGDIVDQAATAPAKGEGGG